MTQNTSSEIFITGSGIISCAGSSPDDIWANVLQNTSGLKDGLGSVQGSHGHNRSERANSFFLIAAKQAMEQAGWEKLTPEDGIIIGTTTGQTLCWDQSVAPFFKKEISFENFSKDFSKQPLGTLINVGIDKLGFTPHRLLLTSACTASTQALAIASLWIQQKKVKRCLVGGIEVLCDLTIEGFKSLQLLADSPSVPFDSNRKGINLSEGAAFVCMESAATSKKNLAKVSGFGMSTDAFHMTSPHPTGGGSLLSMKKALQNANLLPHDIDWIHAHGTGSQFNDLSEGLAIQTLFGENSPYVTSTKTIHGHALAASGILEIIICLQALKNQMVVRTPGLMSPDPKIPVNHPEKTKSHKIKHILKNTLGFGGANASIILSGEI